MMKSELCLWGEVRQRKLEMLSLMNYAAARMFEEPAISVYLKSSLKAGFQPVCVGLKC